MFKYLKNKDTLRGLGIFVVGGLVILFWWIGWFQIIFYLLGLYGAVYIVSYMFKTTAVIGFLLAVGGFVLYVVSAIIGLYWFYQVLQIMFTENFFWGLILLVLLGTFGPLLYYIPIAIGLVIGYPLMFMSEDIEKRFQEDVFEPEAITALENSQNEIQ